MITPTIVRQGSTGVSEGVPTRSSRTWARRRRRCRSRRRRKGSPRYPANQPPTAQKGTQDPAPQPGAPAAQQAVPAQPTSPAPQVSDVRAAVASTAAQVPSSTPWRLLRLPRRRSPRWIEGSGAKREAQKRAEEEPKRAEEAQKAADKKAAEEKAVADKKAAAGQGAPGQARRRARQARSRSRQEERRSREEAPGRAEEAREERGGGGRAPEAGPGRLPGRDGEEEGRPVTRRSWEESIMRVTRLHKLATDESGFSLRVRRPRHAWRSSRPACWRLTSAC